MGSNSSKESAEVIRNRRLREFEEELIENNDGGGTIDNRAPSPPLRDSYFSQFMQKGESQGQDSKRNSVTSTSYLGLLEDDELVNQVPKVKAKDPEVDEAIAELEETFRTLDPDKDKGESDRFGINDGRLSPHSSPREFSRSQSCGPLNLNLNVNQGTSSSSAVSRPAQGAAEHKERRGTPMGPPYAYTRHRRPLGLSHLSRSSGGLTVSTGTGVDDLKGASSAPPGGSNVRDLQQPIQWEPPQIEGFDVEKFREANRPPIAISVRLPSSSSCSNEDPRTSTDTPDKPHPPYTKDELELIMKLEREVY